jgi:hypothetical protein
MKPTLTPARRAWLERLRDHGPAHRGGSRVGYDCMNLGWTTWNYTDPTTGEPLTSDEARARYGKEWWGVVGGSGLLAERITATGRAVLEAGGPPVPAPPRIRLWPAGTNTEGD